MKKIILICIATLVPSFAFSDVEQKPFRIKLTISAPAGEENNVTSYLSREFRALKDVSIVESDPSHHVSIVAMQASSRDGQKNGWVFSCVTDCPTRYKELREFLGEDTKIRGIDTVDLLENTTRVVNHFVCIGANDELEKLTKNIVSEIDGGVLEVARKSRQQIQDINKAYEKEMLKK